MGALGVVRESEMTTVFLLVDIGEFSTRTVLNDKRFDVICENSWSFKDAEEISNMLSLEFGKHCFMNIKSASWGRKNYKWEKIFSSTGKKKAFLSPNNQQFSFLALSLKLFSFLHVNWREKTLFNLFSNLTKLNSIQILKWELSKSFSYL